MAAASSLTGRIFRGWTPPVWAVIAVINWAFVFQFYNLIPNLTVKENIEVGQYLSQKPLEMDALLHLGLWGIATSSPMQLSGGPAAALRHRPGADQESLPCCSVMSSREPWIIRPPRRILALLETINQTYHNTIIIVTHNEPIKQMAHRVLKL